MKSTAAVGRADELRKHLARGLADAVARFTRCSYDDVLPLIPTLLVEKLEAARAELWLWDESSQSAYLTHASGRQAKRRNDYVPRGQGFIGQALAEREPVVNAALAGGNAEETALAHSGLRSLCCYPIAGEEQLVGVLCAYSEEPAGAELLAFWQVFAEITAFKAAESLQAQEKQRQITQLSLLFEATRLLNSTLDLSELLDLILKIARTETKADRGSVFLVDNKRQQLWSIVASGLGDHQEIRMPFGQGVAGRVAQIGETVNAADAYTLEYFDRSFDQKFGYRTRSLLCLPIRHHSGEVIGVIQLLNSSSGSFTEEDEQFLQKLSGHIAMALENARLHRDALEKQRLEKEMVLARSIQRSLLPAGPPVVPGYDIAVMNEMCYAVGGDYYDFLSLGPHSLLLVVADVEGKGMSSAMVMSNLQATLRALVMHLHSLEVLTMSLNEMMCNDTKSGKYLSMFLGLVDTRRNGLHYINAGHVPPVLVNGATGETSRLTEGGMVIGLFSTADYTRGSRRLEPGDILICCTDGISEACNSEEEEFGMDRLAACVARHRNKPAQAIVEAVLAEVSAFADPNVHADDRVLMLMKYTGDGKFATGSSRAS